MLVLYHSTKCLFCRSVPTPERPYVTEAGPAVFDQLYELCVNQLSLVDPTLEMTVTRRVQMSDLVTDALNVLIGVPSNIFCLNKVICFCLRIKGLYDWLIIG